MAADAADEATAKGALAPKRKAAVKLQPVATTAEPTQSGGQQAAVGPTPEAIAAWQALPADQKQALREREAARVFGLAVQHHQNGELDEAVRGYGKSLLLNPKNHDAYNNMGVALRALGNLETAVACYRRSLVLRPDNAGAYSNLGNALRDLGRFEQAIASHTQAVKLTPDVADTHYNLGLAYRDSNRVDDSMACFEKALSFMGDHVDCRWDRALGFLQKGDYKRGFDEYEWRWKLERSPPRGLEQPLWDGSDLDGKTILVHHEQGFGDMIQFARYIPMVKARGGTVVVEAQPELARLFSTLEGADKVVNRGSPLPRFDVYAPMVSLARIFGTTLDTVPADVPYLQAPDPQSVPLPVSMSRHRRVGISWAGRPTHENDANRSVAFANFIELLGIPGVNVFSLQKGPAADDIVANRCQSLVLNLSPRLQDFADTAAVISQLDLVISVDTAIAHLAAALGKPTWVVLPFAGDWRWMTEGDTTPWYPTMRLFRQTRMGEWDSVFTRVYKALIEEMRKDPADG